MDRQSSSKSKYDDVIARAVASMPHDAAARQATYVRARSALLTRMQSLIPPLSAATVEVEQAALESAIQHVEMEFAGSQANFLKPLSIAPGVNPLRPRHRVRIAALCSAGIFFALIAGFIYANRDDPGKRAYQLLRSIIQQPAKRDTAERIADTSSNAPVLPYIYMRQLVPYRSTSAPGTLVIDKAQRYLYVILANVSAIRYGIALGGNCGDAAGRYVISRKAGAPDSQQPAVNDPSGERALYLDVDPRRIHDTTVARSIGRTVKIGCFQLMATDFSELYNRIPIGTRVVVN